MYRSDRSVLWAQTLDMPPSRHACRNCPIALPLSKQSRYRTIPPKGPITLCLLSWEGGRRQAASDS